MLKNWTADEKTAWDSLVSASPDGGFLQSWVWGDFQEALFNSVYRLSDEQEQWLAQCFQLKAGNQWILYIPRGPVFVGYDKVMAGQELSSQQSGRQSYLDFFKELKVFAKERGCFLLRFDPAFETGHPFTDTVSRCAKKARRERQPIHTLILDTAKSEAELLEAMKQKWRYNTRLAEKKGVTTRWSTDTKDAEHFYQLVSQTTERQQFGAYDEDYYATLIEKLGPQHQAAFLFAEYEGKPIAGLLLGFFGKRVLYLHGASNYEHRQLMAPHLLQWEAIKEAKRRNMRYDFWGVAAEPPANKQEAGWGGVTRFKKGFAPQIGLTEYVGTYELRVKPLWYWAYRLRSLLRRE